MHYPSLATNGDAPAVLETGWEGLGVTIHRWLRSALLASAVLLAGVQAPATAQPARMPGRVLAVIDGDTIEVLMEGRRERVRYIGIDTPEVWPPDQVQCYGPEASVRNAQLVGGQSVELESDLTDRDRYGRLLRYVWIGETFVNAELLVEGFAQVTTYPPDVRYVELYRDLQRQARQAGRGLWLACFGLSGETPPRIVPAEPGEPGQ